MKISSMNSLIALVLCAITLSNCAKKSAAPVVISINPWPGYELLYLAEQKGFFEKVGANIKLQQISSLADSQRNFINGRSDGMASTLIEVVQASHLGAPPMEIIMLPDYSNGGDVIISSREINSIKQLKGKTIGLEFSSLGVYMLYKALENAGLTWQQVKVKNIEQLKGKAAIESGEIDAFISYPPASVEILKNVQFHVLFSSAEIPFEILDTVSVRKDVLDQRPKLASKILQAWQMALEYSDEQPDEAYKIMAEREGISSDEFKAALNDIKILSRAEQIELFKNPENINKKAKKICEALNSVGSLTSDCGPMRNLVYQGPL